jgi:hypothetical protein
MNRYVFPELFHVAGAPILVEGKPRTALRWILHPSLGLPRALFRVWRFGGKIGNKTVATTQTSLGTGERVVSWAEGPAAAIALTVTVAAGARLVLRAHSGPLGTGHPVDEETVVGPVTNGSIVLLGSPVASVTASGTGTLNSSAAIISLTELVNAPGWVLLETVGLPVDKEFSGTGYPLDKQGPVGAEQEPVLAAMHRVKFGSPDTGWPNTTDRGTPVTPFVRPDEGVLVQEELKNVRKQVLTLLTEVSDPAEHAAFRMQFSTRAPKSVHGVDAPDRWQSQAADAEVSPLGSLLIPSATDPYAALALGFGTALTLPTQQPEPGKFPSTFVLVTVEHKVVLKGPPESPSTTVFLDGELAALYVEPQHKSPAVPTDVSAQAPSTPGRSAHLDPPKGRDERWLEVVRVSWASPITLVGSQARPTGYAIARALDGDPMDICLEERHSGGWSAFVPATNPENEAPEAITYTESGMPELFPGEPSNAVYAVAATDWFGRWSSWASADHPRVSVAPQVPAVRDVSVELDGNGSSQEGTATVEFVWDWSHRSPAKISIRLLTHAEGTPPPSVGGSVFEVGGGMVSDPVVDFSSASIDDPPSEVKLIAGESLGNLRTYQLEIPKLKLDFEAHPRIRVTARAQGTERVGFGLPSQWSPDRSTMLASPVPPPPPFVPAAMQWTSVRDPRGVARTTLSWSSSAPEYVVYAADETAIRRELNQPSADLEVAAADRLPALRALNFGEARRAFKRIAGPRPGTSLPVELPRGSDLIHFYGIAPVSVTGVEGPLPSAGNAYFAVAAPRAAVPEPPRLLARDHEGVVTLTIEVPETRVAVGKVAIHRAPNRTRAVSPEHAGPPIAVLDESLGVRANGFIRFTFEDTAPGHAWQSVFYRAVAWARTELPRGVFGGSSEPTRAIEVVVTTSAPPALSDLRVEDVATAPEHRLVSFVTDATLARTPRGSHAFAVETITPSAQVNVRRVAADALPLLRDLLPGPADQQGTIFRHHPTAPRTGRTYAWVPRAVRAVIVEIADPSGRTTRQTWTAP